jgi:Ca-activated chloride channel family protein
MNWSVLRSLELAQPQWLLLGLPLAWAVWRLLRRGGAPSIAFPMLSWILNRGEAARLRRGSGPLGWLTLALALAILALARPQQVKIRQEDNTQGIAICLTVDVSLSMLIEDFYIGGEPVNRLVAAKRVMRDFIRGRQSDRIGIVAFAGAPYYPCPLTLDRQWLEANLERVQTGVMEDGTAIGSGLAAAARRLDRETLPSKVIILLTDGANNSGKLSPQDAAKLAATLGIRIYTIAIGTPGVHMIPLPNGRTITSGRQEFDEGTLQAVAQIGGGSFYMAQDLGALAEIFATIDKLEKKQIRQRTLREVEEWFHWPLGLALIILSLVLLARLTLRRTSPSIVTTSS